MGEQLLDTGSIVTSMENVNNFSRKSLIPSFIGKILEHGSRGGGRCDILLGSSTVTMRVAPGNMMPTPVTQHDTHKKPTPGYHGDASRQFGIAVYARLRTPTVRGTSPGCQPSGDSGYGDVVTNCVHGTGPLTSAVCVYLTSGNRQPLQAALHKTQALTPTLSTWSPTLAQSAGRSADANGQAVKLSLTWCDSVTDLSTPSR